MLRILGLDDPDREAALSRLARRAVTGAPEVETAARAILDDVRARGDAAVRELTARFEGRHLDELELSAGAWSAIADSTSPEMAGVITRAHERIRRFHAAEAERILGGSYRLEERTAGISGGGAITLGLSLRPLHRVGLYAPGGTALYPSSVLMTAVPAKVAGVGELILVTPGPSPEALFAARVAGVDRVFAIGGAQAVGALAYGTASVPRVDKIVGPGNAWVAAAKRLVFGEVDIDQVAGPSEVLVVSDGSGAGHVDAEVIAADLLAQAEHDTEAYAVLVTTSIDEARAVAEAVERQLGTLPRERIARSAIDEHGAAVVVGSVEEAIAFANRFAPEHLEVHLAGVDATSAAALFPDAGAIFLGHAPEALGDYYAGPNHVLPTGGSARFSSPLGVHDFVKRTSVLDYDGPALLEHAEDVARFARAEGLEAHARSVELRARGLRAQAAARKPR